jgi:hypothetical protein
MKTTAGNFALAESVVKGNADVVDLVRGNQFLLKCQ